MYVVFDLNLFRTTLWSFILTLTLSTLLCWCSFIVCWSMLLFHFLSVEFCWIKLLFLSPVLLFIIIAYVILDDLFCWSQREESIFFSCLIITRSLVWFIVRNSRWIREMRRLEMRCRVRKAIFSSWRSMYQRLILNSDSSSWFCDDDEGFLAFFSSLIWFGVSRNERMNELRKKSSFFHRHNKKQFLPLFFCFPLLCCISWSVALFALIHGFKSLRRKSVHQESDFERKDVFVICNFHFRTVVRTLIFEFHAQFSREGVMPLCSLSSRFVFHWHQPWTLFYNNRSIALIMVISEPRRIFTKWINQELIFRRSMTLERNSSNLILTSHSCIIYFLGVLEDDIQQTLMNTFDNPLDAWKAFSKSNFQVLLNPSLSSLVLSDIMFLGSISEMYFVQRMD